MKYCIIYFLPLICACICMYFSCFLPLICACICMPFAAGTSCWDLWSGGFWKNNFSTACNSWSTKARRFHYCSLRSLTIIFCIRAIIILYHFPLSIVGYCVFIDAEHALDPVLAKSIGVNTENLLLSQPDCGEQALSLVDTIIRSGSVDVVVVDSVSQIFVDQSLLALLKAGLTFKL